jgi:hypothetical protein
MDWKTRLWDLFPRRLPTEGREDYFFDSFLEAVRKQGKTNVVISLGLLLLDKEQGNSLDLSHIEAAIDKYGKGPPDVHAILDRLLLGFNLDFKLLFPESQNQIPRPLQESKAVCPTCSRSFMVEWKLCGTYKSIIMLEPCHSNKDGIVDVAKAYKSLWNNQQPPEVFCKSCKSKPICKYRSQNRQDPKPVLILATPPGTTGVSEETFVIRGSKYRLTVVGVEDKEGRWQVYKTQVIVLFSLTVSELGRQLKRPA